MQIKAGAVDMETFEILSKEARWSERESAAATARRLVMERNMYRAALHAINPEECYRVERLMRGDDNEK